MAIFGKTSVSNSSKQSTIIGTDAYIKGDFRLSSMIYVDGNLEGNINSSDSVVVGKNGVLTGDIKASKVVINGQVTGNIDANSIEILAGAMFKGDMEVYEFSCEPSGKFIGHCRYRDEKSHIFENSENSDPILEDLENSKDIKKS